MSNIYSQFPKEPKSPDNEVARLREALELIASPMRPDGTYNRDRRACELLAKEALAPEPEEPETYAHPDKCIGNVTEPTIEGVTMDEWYGGFAKIESTEHTNNP